MTPLVSYLKDLIGFQTVSGLDHQKEVTDLFRWIEYKTDAALFTVQTVNENGFGSLIISPKNQNATSPLICTAHIDVVPGEDSVFVPIEKEGRLYGRGALDMKFAAACYVLAIVEEKDLLVSKNIRFIFTSDEEIGGRNGVKALIDKGFFDTECVMLPDGGHNMTLVKAEKGVLHLKITAQGKSAHGSRPWEGSNPFDQLLSGFEELKQDLPPVLQHSWESTLTLTKIEGGTAVNQIPDMASFYFDIRFIETITKEALMSKVERAFPKCIVEVLASGDHVSLPLDNPYVKTFSQAFERVTNRQVEYSYDHGASDARYFTPVGTPVILMKPVGGGAHSPEEWVDIQSLETFYQVFKEFLSSI